MDRGAWQATVHRAARVGHDLATKPPPPYYAKFFPFPEKAFSLVRNIHFSFSILWVIESNACSSQKGNTEKLSRWGCDERVDTHPNKGRRDYLPPTSCHVLKINELFISHFIFLLCAQLKYISLPLGEACGWPLAHETWERVTNTTSRPAP